MYAYAQQYMCVYIYMCNLYIQLYNVYVWPPRLYVEEHDPSWGLEGATQSSMQTAMAGLRTDGFRRILMGFYRDFMGF